MAENKSKGPEHDDFVSKVSKDPSKPADALLLSGFIGKSSEEGHTRIHFDPELKHYVDIPNDAILHSQKIPAEHSTLGGSHVWIKSDAEVIHGPVGPGRTKAKFFEGPIAAGAGGAAALPFLTPLPQCHPQTPGCPSHMIFCPTPVVVACGSPFQPQCPVQSAGCPPPPPSHLHFCPTPVVVCGSPFQPQCPVQSAGCPPPPSVGIVCPTPVVVCASPIPHCPIDPQQAISHVQPCPPSPPPMLCPVTLNAACPTHFGLQCPTAPPAMCLPTPHIACPTHFELQCPTAAPAMCLPTPHIACPTGLQCQTTALPMCLPTPHIVCPTHFGLQCPTAAPAMCLPTPHIACPTHFGQPCPPSPPPAMCVSPVPHCPQPTATCPVTPVVPCQPPTPPHICPTPTVLQGCHTPLHGCPTPPAMCPTPACPTPACPSVHIPCLTGPVCPPATPGCQVNPGGEQVNPAFGAKAGLAAAKVKEGGGD